MGFQWQDEQSEIETRNVELQFKAFGKLVYVVIQLTGGDHGRFLHHTTTIHAEREQWLTSCYQRWGRLFVLAKHAKRRLKSRSFIGQGGHGQSRRWEQAAGMGYRRPRYSMQRWPGGPHRVLPSCWVLKQYLQIRLETKEQVRQYDYGTVGPHGC